MKSLKLTYDGFGLNDARDGYKTRVAYIQPGFRKHGKAIADAVNSHEALLEFEDTIRNLRGAIGGALIVKKRDSTLAAFENALAKVGTAITQADSK